MFPAKEQSCTGPDSSPAVSTFKMSAGAINVRLTNVFHGWLFEFVEIRIMQAKVQIINDQSCTH